MVNYILYRTLFPKSFEGKLFGSFSSEANSTLLISLANLVKKN